jgi:hypothetical protein
MRQRHRLFAMPSVASRMADAPPLRHTAIRIRLLLMPVDIARLSYTLFYADTFCVFAGVPRY